MFHFYLAATLIGIMLLLHYKPYEESSYGFWAMSLFVLLWPITVPLAIYAILSGGGNERY